MLKRMTFMCELAEWLAKQEYLIDTEDQIEAMRRVIEDLKIEEQKKIKENRDNV